MQLKIFMLLIALSFAAKQNKNVVESDGNFAENMNENGAETVFLKIEQDKYAKINKKESSSQYLGVGYIAETSKWQALTNSKHEKKNVYNGGYANEETTAHASDTLARKLMENGEQGHKLNFPDDDTEVLPEKTTSSQHIGVSYHVRNGKWHVQRHSKHKKETIGNGYFVNEETAAHASDTLAKKLIANGEQGHKLNFPDDDTEVFPQKKKNSSQHIGVSFDVKTGKWQAQRHSKHKKRMILNGYYVNEETAAHASDTLAKELIANGEQGHKLNFPDDDTEVFPDEKTLSSQYVGVSFVVKLLKWKAQRRSKHEKKTFCNGYYGNEETAARASDTLARKLMANSEQGHRLNFPDDDAEVHPELQGKRKRHSHEDLGNPKNKDD